MTMTDEEYKAKGGLPLDQLTKDQNRIIEFMLRAAWKAGNFEVVSPERTKLLVQTAIDAGTDEAEAQKLARHYDAATELFLSFPESQKASIRENAKAKLS